jgi:hypothetical protein
MTRLRIWFRRRVRALMHSSPNHSSRDRRKSVPSTPLYDLKISAPIPLSNDILTFHTPSTRPRPYSLPIAPFDTGPDLSSTFSPISPHPKEFLHEDIVSISTPPTVAEEAHDISAAPSLCSDSDNDSDIMPEHTWPATPTSPMRSAQRMSFLQILDNNASRPHSFAASQFEEMRDRNSNPWRLSQMSRESGGREKRASRGSEKRMSVVGSAGEKRMSVMSRSGSKRMSVSGRRASVMSVSGREHGMEWDGEGGVGRRFSRRMSWGFETYATTTSAYAPVRI